MPADGVTCFGRYQLDAAQGLTRGMQRVHVTPKSLSVLCALAERAGQVVTKEDSFPCRVAGHFRLRFGPDLLYPRDPPCPRR